MFWLLCFLRWNQGHSWLRNKTQNSFSFFLSSEFFQSALTQRTTADRGRPFVILSISQTGISHIEARTKAILSFGGKHIAGVVPFGREFSSGAFARGTFCKTICRRESFTSPSSTSLNHSWGSLDNWIYSSSISQFPGIPRSSLR